MGLPLSPLCVLYTYIIHQPDLLKGRNICSTIKMNFSSSSTSYVTLQKLILLIYDLINVTSVLFVFNLFYKIIVSCFSKHVTGPPTKMMTRLLGTIDRMYIFIPRGGNATYSGILSSLNPWTEEPGGI